MTVIFRAIISSRDFFIKRTVLSTRLIKYIAKFKNKYQH
jgi:hypothetical protein